jgi:hemerythrin-like domain-containing protein
MNAIELLKLDHRVVDALFQKAMSMDPSKRGPVYKKISNELAAHAHIEEAIFYPRLIKEGDKELKKIVLEGIEEHAQIHMFHDQLDTMKPAEEKFEPKLTVLQEDIRHHVKEEENEMFGMVEDQFSADSLERLGEELEAERKRRKASLPALPPTKPWVKACYPV